MNDFEAPLGCESSTGRPSSGSVSGRVTMGAGCVPGQVGGSETVGPVGDTVGDAVGDTVGDTVGDSVDDSVDDAVDDAIGNKDCAMG